MRRLVALALTFVVVALGPTPLAFAQGQGTGGVNGVAADAAKNPLANHTVRLRNLANGEITSVTQSAANGSFSFAGVNPGNFVIEIVNSAGNVIATSSTVAVTAGTTAAITVTASAITSLAAASGASGLAALFTGTSLVVVTAAGLAAVTIGVVATQDDSSPSR
jgi:hypothetical protein